MKTPVFKGSATAIVTPFRDGKVDYKKLGELIDFQIAGGTAAIVINGTTGENSTQTIAESTATIDFCIKHVNSRVKVIAGTGSNDTQSALFMSQAAEKSGADALLMVTPYYNKTSQRGLIKHYTFLADRVNLPIILYNVPSRTGLSFTAETYIELAKHPNINGVKEASGNFDLIGDTLASQAAQNGDFYMWSGNDGDFVPMMSIGGLGVISVLSNVIPAEVAKMTELCFEGNYTKASKLFLKYFDLYRRLFIEVSPMPVKAALNLMGMDVGQPRMPLCDLAPENLGKLKTAMQKAGLIN